MDILLFGMQGSGKGTQGKILAEKYGLRFFEMGAELRRNIESGTPLGEKIKATVLAGKLVDDETVLSVVEAFLTSVPAEKPVLFDGIPRTAAQSEGLLALLKRHGRDAFALHIKISTEEALKRLTQRRMCSACKTVYPAFYEGGKCQNCGGALITRHDDNASAIGQRLELFEKETVPVIKSFYAVDRLIEVDGEQNIEKVTEEMIEKAGYLFS